MRVGRALPKQIRFASMPGGFFSPARRRITRTQLQATRCRTSWLAIFCSLVTYVAFASLTSWLFYSPFGYNTEPNNPIRNSAKTMQASIQVYEGNFGNYLVPPEYAHCFTKRGKVDMRRKQAVTVKQWINAKEALSKVDLARKNNG